MGAGSTRGAGSNGRTGRARECDPVVVGNARGVCREERPADDTGTAGSNFSAATGLDERAGGIVDLGGGRLPAARAAWLVVGSGRGLARPSACRGAVSDARSGKPPLVSLPLAGALACTVGSATRLPVVAEGAPDSGPEAVTEAAGTAVVIAAVSASPALVAPGATGSFANLPLSPGLGTESDRGPMLTSHFRASSTAVCVASGKNASVATAVSERIAALTSAA